MEIGKPERVVIIEPIEDPVPKREPAPAPEREPAQAPERIVR